ncbi:hypothetical protein SPRG_00903 [Saprolegnia parasitica CBS 223.65]|uniref:Uncharacterized protein n=1 Tax=Saprolegnia parasitica (strain CBS 223.65) TaxID=695850 RepID=A0A067D761_SAPPC|nr:hypothetical protein SPRG_00903 [Saprolegnia parasitica CBS 223.65]KDO34842.1 hypothetical protein SPRG_00903 [Saprolegnia parasitica CBS 223.65]|eukprot:XP_012194505.1 hypothetical protein SPRG_00903 [Saprolegnia parasitica CBS 223.65]
MADEAPLEQRFAAASTEFARTTIRTKEDAQKLHGRVNDWREDVNTLAGQIAAQLNVCKSLRTSKAMHSIAATPTPLDVVRFSDVDPFHLMRSDIRSLYDFRLSTLRSQILDASNTTSIDLELDKDAAQLKLILDEPSTVEKAGDADTAFQSMLKFTLAKSDLCCKIADDVLRTKRATDLERGIEDEGLTIDARASVLLSRETKLFISFYAADLHI